MARRNDAAAEAAANAASEAARTLQARAQEVRQESQPQPTNDAPKRPEPKTEAPEIKVEKKPRPHVQAMDDLLKRRGLDVQEGEPKAEEPAVEPKVEEPKQEEQPAVEVKPEVPVKVKLKVDGEEHEVEPAEIEEAGGEKAWRIARAQENRLKKINEAAAESKAREERIAKLAEAVLQQQAPKPQPQLSDQQFIAERMNKIRFGTEDEAALAQIEISQRLNQPVDQNVLIKRTTANLKYDLADAKFKEEFADIASNPLLLKLAKQLEGERLSQHVKNGHTDWDALSTLDWGLMKRTIGNEVRSAFGRQSQPAPQGDKTAGNPSPASVKEERKASIVNLPTAAARADLPKEEKEPTPEEARKQWLAETKKKRGQV